MFLRISWRHQNVSHINTITQLMAISYLITADKICQCQLFQPKKRELAKNEEAFVYFHLNQGHIITKHFTNFKCHCYHFELRTVCVCPISLQTKQQTLRWSWWHSVSRGSSWHIVLYICFQSKSAFVGWSISHLKEQNENEGKFSIYLPPCRWKIGFIQLLQHYPSLRKHGDPNENKRKLNYYLSIPMPIENWVKFHSPQNISGVHSKTALQHSEGGCFEM